MANRYWIGNGGNTNDTAHWSTTSGGVGGASVPSTSDNAYWDANSFTLTGQIVTVNAWFKCTDMVWTGVTNAPTLAGTSPISIYGSLTYATGLIVTHTGDLTFSATSTGKTITSAGVITPQTVYFSGVGGEWTLQDDLNIGTKQLSLSDGSLNTNGKTVTCGDLLSSTTTLRTLTLGSSVINIASNCNFSGTTNLTLNANTSTINMTGANKTFTGGGLSYNKLTSNGTITIVGSNTFNVLTIATGKTLKLTSGTTQTITSLVCNGTTASPSTLQSVTAGSAATIALPVGRYFIRHTSIKDITITGATAVTSIAGTNVSGNTGITFVTKFEVGRIKNDGTLNWYNSTTGIVGGIDAITLGGITASGFQQTDATLAKFKSGSSTYTNDTTSQTFVDAFCTANSLVTISITSATPPQGVWTVTSAAGSFTITSTVAESNDITFDYYIQKVV